MILIAAMSADRVIGSGAGMPWNVPDEYAQWGLFLLRAVDHNRDKLMGQATPTLPCLE